MQQQRIKRFRVLLLGGANVGKTALVNNIQGRPPSTVVDPTIGVGYAPYEAVGHEVKGIFADLGGQLRFAFMLPGLLSANKDCILLVVDNLNIRDTLDAIRYYLEAIDKYCPEEKMVPIGLVVNHKPGSSVDPFLLHRNIAENFEHRLRFVTHCSVIDASIRERLFNQLARISGVPILHEMPQDWVSWWLSPAQSWGAWFYQKSSDACFSVVEGVSTVSTYVGSFFQRRAPARLAIQDRLTVVEPEPVPLSSSVFSYVAGLFGGQQQAAPTVLVDQPDAAQQRL